ncbi:MAG TPA: DUF3237 domain-containing protein [Phenylobacterium sp.]
MTQVTPAAPQMRHLFTLRAALAERIDAGPGALGRRSFNRVGEGSFAGERLRGVMTPGSGDWMLTRSDGVNMIDARVMLVTDDGAAIYMRYEGRVAIPPAVLDQARDPARRGELEPSDYFMRSIPVFETGAPEYAWLNDVLAVGAGRLTPEGVTYEVFEVL